MDSNMYHLRLPTFCATLLKDGFQNSFHIVAKKYRFFYKNGTNALDDFCIEISSPKSYAVTSGDGTYFTYEDILEKEPFAKEYFDKLTQPLSKITKPIYQLEKPVYSVRISKQAYTDLQKSAFSKNMRDSLTSKWRFDDGN